MSLTDFVNFRIGERMSGIDKSEQVQSEIDSELNFRRNSVNLYVGRRASGKTFNVLRELIKLSQLPDKGGYSLFIYCTDKTNDPTVNELQKEIKLTTKIVSYDKVEALLADHIDAKEAYDKALRNGIREQDLTDESREDILSSVFLEHFTDKVPGTIVLYDDAINIFNDAKNKRLLKLLHENRQAKITYFLCMQDPFAIKPQVRRNLDTCILFGGYRDTMMLYPFIRQMFGSSEAVKTLIQDYLKLGYREGMVFDFYNDLRGTQVRILEE
jgi:hypothetical protein